MAKLAVWSIEEGGGNIDAGLVEPKEVGRSRIGLEKWLEGWIVKKISLIGEDLTLVGQQVSTCFGESYSNGFGQQGQDWKREI